MSIFDEHLSTQSQTVVDGFRDIIGRFNNNISLTRYVKNTHVLSYETQAILEELVPQLGKFALGLNMVDLVFELISAYHSKNKNIFLAVQLSITVISLTMALIAPPALAIAFFSLSILNHLALLQWHWKDKESLKKKNLMYTKFKKQYTNTMTNRTLMLMSTITIITAMILTSYCSLAIASTIAWLAVIGLVLTRMFESKTGLLAKYISPYKINTQETENDPKKFHTNLLQTLVDHAITLNTELKRNPNGLQSEKRNAKKEMALGSIIFLLLPLEPKSLIEALNQHTALIAALKKYPEDVIKGLKEEIVLQIKEMASEKIIDPKTPANITQFKHFLATKKTKLTAMSQSFFSFVSDTEKWTEAVHHHLSLGVHCVHGADSHASPTIPGYIPLVQDQSISPTEAADNNNTCASSSV